jgi:hypothetical protein
VPRTYKAAAPTMEDAPSTGYGDEAALLESIGQVPMVAPDEVPNLSDPSMRPAEPVTTGLPVGPGAGPEVLNTAQDPVRDVLRAMMVAFPNPDVARLIDQLDLQGR